MMAPTLASRQPCRPGGFSRLELMVAVLVIAILAGILLERLLHYQEMAEKARMEYAISSIKSGLRQRMASLLVAGRAQDYRLLAKQNPMDLLEGKPDNYAGELTAVDGEQLASGTWYFDQEARALVYLVRRGAHFQSAGAGRKRVRLKIVIVQNSAEAGKGSGSEDDPVNSVAIEIVEPYRWF